MPSEPAWFGMRRPRAADIPEPSLTGRRTPSPADFPERRVFPVDSAQGGEFCQTLRPLPADEKVSGGGVRRTPSSDDRDAKKQSPSGNNLSAKRGSVLMAMRRLRVYTGPDLSPSQPRMDARIAESSVRVSLGEVLPLLADAVASNRTWLTDFKDDEIAISADLHDVLSAYRHFRRPGA